MFIHRTHASSSSSSSSSTSSTSTSASPTKILRAGSSQSNVKSLFSKAPKKVQTKVETKSEEKPEKAEVEEKKVVEEENLFDEEDSDDDIIAVCGCNEDNLMRIENDMAHWIETKSHSSDPTLCRK